MKDYMEIGATPCEENCAQVGSDDYTSKARKECNAYVNQLWRWLKSEKGITKDNAPESFNIVVRSNPHDFGSYLEVACRFDDSDEEAMELAFSIEENGPTHWDMQAKKELAE